MSHVASRSQYPWILEGPLGASVTVPDLAEALADPEFTSDLRLALERRRVIRLVAATVPRRSTCSRGSSDILWCAKFPPCLVFRPSRCSTARPGRDPALDEGEAQILHHDYARRPEVPAWAILHARTGTGRPNTMGWVDTTAVYQSLPAKVRALAHTCSVNHPILVDQVLVRVARSVPTLSEEMRNSGPNHPLVCRKMPSSDPYLLLPVRRDALVHDLPREDAERLLTSLWDAVAACQVRWTLPMVPGKIFIWDNLQTVHDRSPFDSSGSRCTWFMNLSPTIPLAA